MTNSQRASEETIKMEGESPKGGKRIFALVGGKGSKVNFSKKLVGVSNPGDGLSGLYEFIKFYQRPMIFWCGKVYVGQNVHVQI